MFMVILETTICILMVGVSGLKTYNLMLWERLLKINPNYKTDHQRLYNSYYTSIWITLAVTCYTMYVVAKHSWTIGIIVTWLFFVYNRSLWIYVRNHKQFNIKVVTK